MGVTELNWVMGWLVPQAKHVGIELTPEMVAESVKELSPAFLNAQGGTLPGPSLTLSLLLSSLELSDTKVYKP